MRNILTPLGHLACIRSWSWSFKICARDKPSDIPNILFFLKEFDIVGVCKYFLTYNRWLEKLDKNSFSERSVYRMSQFVKFPLRRNSYYRWLITISNSIPASEYISAGIYLGVWYLKILRLINHRIAWVGRAPRIIRFQPPCYRQGHQTSKIHKYEYNKYSS